MTEITRDTGYETAWNEGETQTNDMPSKASQDNSEYVNAHNEMEGAVATPVHESQVEAKPIEAAADKAKSFKEAFAAARAAGEKVFEWNGKRFTTQLASEAKTVAAKPAVQSVVKKPVVEPKKDITGGVDTEEPEFFDRSSQTTNRAAVVTKPAEKSTGRGVIDTSNIDSKTLLPKK